MTGVTDLDTLLQSMRPVLHPDVFVYATTDRVSQIDVLCPVMLFHEAEGITVIVPRDRAERLTLAYEFSCRMITLNIHSSLDAVGFLARITECLAAQKMAVNAVSAFFS